MKSEVCKKCEECKDGSFEWREICQEKLSDYCKE